MPYQSTKSYPHELGLSCAFRQWRAKSHCNQVHGYALAFDFVFECRELDDRNWVADFGGFKSLKAFLVDMFDHTTCVAEDDPQLAFFKHGAELGLFDLRVVPAVGCEMFARMAYEFAVKLIADEYGDRVRVVMCQVKEHGANSAIYGNYAPPVNWYAQSTAVQHQD